MWDLFNKKTIKVLQILVKEYEDKLELKERQLSKLETELTKQNSKNSELTQESEKKQRALDTVLDELRAFLIQNKMKNLNYDCLDVTNDLIDDFANINEYVLDLNIELINLRSRSIRRKFLSFLDALQQMELVSSYRVEVDQPIIKNHRTEGYTAVVYLYSVRSILTIDNLLLQLLHKSRITIQSHNMENEKTIEITGYKRETYY